jgi:hypothetical protein
MASRAGKQAPPITLVAKDGLPYVRGVDAWHSGIAGLAVHRIPEHPETFTVSHRPSGLRIGASRFASVQDACEMLAQTFGDKVDFTQSLEKIKADPLFAICLDAFVRLGQQVPRDMENVTRVTTEGVLRGGQARKRRVVRRPGVEFD